MSSVVGPLDCSDLSSYDNLAAEYKRLTEIIDSCHQVLPSLKLSDKKKQQLTKLLDECTSARAVASSHKTRTQCKPSKELLTTKVRKLRKLLVEWSPKLSKLQPTVQGLGLPNPPTVEQTHTERVTVNAEDANCSIGIKSDGRTQDTKASTVCSSRVQVAGQLYTWGRGSDGQLGQSEVRYPGDNCALPHPICTPRAMISIVHVACGGGQQGCTAAVAENGE